MARLPRLDHPGALHHVMNRGARREPVFLQPGWYARFLYLVRQLHDRYGLLVHGYALMPNHFHLMLESVHGNLSDGMRSLTANYAHWLNQEQGWDGPVFRGRFLSRAVVDDAHWRHLLAYLHLNPVTGGLVESAGDWQWSSHRAYVGETAIPDWLETDDLLDAYDGRKAYAEYLVALGRNEVEAPDSFDPSQLYRRGTQSQSPSRLVRPRLRRPAAGAALRAVSRVTSTPVPTLRSPRPKREDREARDVAIWWLARRCFLSRREVASLIRTHPTQVSRVVRRVDRLAVVHPRTRAWIRDLWGTDDSLASDPSRSQEGSACSTEP